VLGLAGQLVDQRARAETGPLWPPRLLPDVAVLGLAVAVAAVLRPALSVDLPVGPLGGLPGLGEAIVALVIGVGGALLVDSPALARRGDAVVWAAVGALVALTVVIGSGALTLRAQAIAPVFAVADVLGIGLRAAAVGVAARSGLPWGIAAAVSLGLVEGLLLPRAPGLALGFVPALILLAIALAVREPAETARA
jgi:hypothetical protein